MPKILVIGAGNFSIGALEKLLDLAKHPDNFKITNIRANSKRYDIIRHQPFFLYEAGIIDEQPVSRIKKIDISASTLPPIEMDNKPTIEEALKSDIIFTSVTENGLNLTNKLLDFENENIKHDISEPDNPKTIQGICAYALYQKYEAYKRGEKSSSLTIIPFENLEDNGKILRSSIVSLIEAQKVMVDEEGKIDKDFTFWLRQNKGLICCNTIVDRICPDFVPKQGENGSKKALYNQVRNSIIEDYQDKDPLIFAAELPVGRMHMMIECQNDIFGKELLEDFKKSDISIVRNVKPYSEVKRKVLNSGVHFLGAVIGAYQGKDPKTGEKYKYINQVIENPQYKKFLENTIKQEIIPAIKGVDDRRMTDFADTCLTRAANPYFKDGIDRLARDFLSRDKLKKRCFSLLYDGIREEIETPNLYLMSAVSLDILGNVSQYGEHIGLENVDEKIYKNEQIEFIGRNQELRSAVLGKDTAFLYSEALETNSQDLLAISRSKISINYDKKIDTHTLEVLEKNINYIIGDSNLNHKDNDNMLKELTLSMQLLYKNGLNENIEENNYYYTNLANKTLKAIHLGDEQSYSDIKPTRINQIYCEESPTSFNIYEEIAKTRDYFTKGA